MNLKSYNRKIIALSFVLFALSVLHYFVSPAFLISDYLLFLVPFFMLVSLLTRSINEKKARKDTRKSLKLYFISSSLRLFFYLMILIAYGLLNREDAPAFFLTFLLFYFIFTATEVSIVVKEASK